MSTKFWNSEPSKKLSAKFYKQAANQKLKKKSRLKLFVIINTFSTNISRANKTINLRRLLAGYKLQCGEHRQCKRDKKINSQLLKNKRIKYEILIKNQIENHQAKIKPWTFHYEAIVAQKTCMPIFLSVRRENSLSPKRK